MSVSKSISVNIHTIWHEPPTKTQVAAAAIKKNKIHLILFLRKSTGKVLWTVVVPMVYLCWRPNSNNRLPSTIQRIISRPSLQAFMLLPKLIVMIKAVKAPTFKSMPR